MIYNEKKLIKRILSIGMAFVLIFSNTHLETYAAGNEPILTVNNGRYNLPLKTSSQSAPVLPEGLSWNKSEELLIMNNYVGGAIEIENYGSRFSGIENFTIELIGENNISFISGEDYGGFLSNNHITFKGNGSLKLTMIEREKASSIFTAIRVNGGDLILKDNVHLEIYMHAQRIDYFEAIDVSTLEVKDDAKIVIDARGKKVVGMRNILIVNNNASVDIRVKGEQKTIGWQTPLTTGAGNAMKIETNGEFNIESESTGGVALAIDNARRNPRKSDPDNTPVHIKSGYVQLKSKSPLPESKAIAKPLAGKGNFAYSFTGENSEVEKYAPVRLTSPFHIATAGNRSDELENNDSILLGAVPSNRNYIVLGVDFFNEEVTWSISGQHSRDTKIENGLLTIGNDERKTRITVSARHKRENTTVTKVFQVIPKATLRFEAKEYGSFEGQTEKIKEIRVLAETPNALKESDIPNPVADVGAEFIGWNRELPNRNTIFNQTEKYQYEALFRKKEYLITKDVPESLDINIVVKEKDTQRNKSENEAVHYNDIIELQIKPKDKKQHVLHSVVVKRKSNDEIIKRFSINLSGEVTDSFIMPAENVEIQAVSEKKGYTISKQKVKGVTIQVPQSAKNGEKVLVSANSEDAKKYEVKQILVTKENGELVEPLEQVDGNTRFTMPTENVNVTAKVKYLIDTHLLPSEDVKVMVNSKTETVKALPGEKIQIDLRIKKPKLKAIENIVVKDSANHVIAVNYLNDEKTSAEFIMPQDTASVTTTLRNKPIIVERIGDVHLGKKIYAAGENLSIQDMTANIQLSDDTSKIISLQDFSANGIEMLLISNKGSQEQSIVIQLNDIIALNRNHTKIVLKYQGQVMKEIPITVGDAKVNNLSIEGTVRTEYAAGERLDFGNAKLVIRKTDGSQEKVSLNNLPSEFTITPSKTAGLQKSDSEIVITHTGTQTSHRIPIMVGDAKVNNLSIEGTVRTEYAAGERLDFGNAKLVIQKTDGSQEKVSLNNLPSEFTITPSKTAGLQKSDSEIVITHNATKTIHRIPITVGDAKVNNLSIEGDFKKSYAAGEQLDFGNAKLVIRKTDGSQEKVSLNALSNEYTISPSKTAGLQKSVSEIVITHTETQTSHRIPITVGDAKVNNLSIEGDFKKNYAAGERLDFGNAKLVIRKTDASEEKVSLNNLSSEFTITPNKTAGLQKSVREIVITHTETQTSHRIPITVGDAKVNNLSIEGDFKKNYAAGERLDFGNAKLVIQKTDGSQEKVSLNNLQSEFTITPNKTEGLQKNDSEIVITHTETQTSHRISITVGDAKVNNLSVEGDFKKSYAAGERLDFGNAKLVIQKTDGSQEKVLLNALSNEYTISPSKTAGLQKSVREIVITHTETQTSHRIPITVGDAKVNNLSIEGDFKKSYAAGERLDFGNAKLVIQKTDGSQEKVSLNNLSSEFTITPNKTAGLQKNDREIVITHTGTQTIHRIPITVGDAKVNNLSIEGDFKKSYAAGERLDFGNAKLVIRKTDASEEKVSLKNLPSEFTITPNKTAGLQKSVREIVITHTETQTSHRIPITVGDAKVNNLSIEGDFKKSYAAGERLDFGNAKLVIRKTDGSQEKVSLNNLQSEFTITPNKTAGLQKSVREIVITHTGTQTIHRIPITVGDAKVNNLSVEGDFKKSYAAGERLNFGNAKLVIRKTDGSQEKVSLNNLSSEFTITPSKTAGLQKSNREIVITHTKTQTIHRIPITVGDAKVNNLSIEGTVRTEYAAGERLDFGNAKLVIRKTEGSEEKVSLNALSNEYTISPSKTAGLQKSDREIVITHTETQTSHRIPITVGDAKPQDLLLSPPTKRIYDKGDIFIPDGMMATITKTDGSSIQLIPFSRFGAHHLELVTPVAGAKLMQEGQQRVLVRYQKNGESLEGETTIEIGAAQLRDIELRPPTKQHYVEGQTLSQEGMEIKLKWSDREEIVPLDELANYGLEMIPSFGTPLTVSNNKIEIRHTDSGKRKEHTLTVVPISVTGLTANEIKKDYVENNLLDLSNLIVTLHKNNGTQEQVNYADFAKYNLSVNPEHETKLTTANSEVVITHAESKQKTSIPIRVEKAKVVRIEIIGLKEKYFVGDVFSANDIRVRLQDRDGALSDEISFAQFKQNGLMLETGNLMLNNENQAVLSKGSYNITIRHTSGVSNAVTIQVEDKVTLKLSGGFPEEFNPKGFLVLDILRIVRTVNNADEEIIDFKKFAEKGIEISHANSMPLERDFDFVITDTSSGASLSLPVNIYWGIRYQSGKETNEEIVANQKYNGEEQLRIILPQNTFTPPEGKEFAGWKVNPENSSDSMDEKLYPEGEEYLVESKVVFVAQWKDIEKAPEIISPVDPNNSQALPPNNPDGKPGGGKDEDKTGNDGDGGDGNDGDGKKTDENTTPKLNTDTGGTESIIKDEGKITQPDNSVQTGDGSSTSNNPNPPSNPKDGSQETGSVPSISPGDAMNQSDNSSQQSGSGNSGQPEDNVSAPNDAENGSQGTGNSGATTQTPGNPSGGDAASSDSATGENQDKDSEKTELPNPQANDSTKNSSTDDEAQRQKLEQIEREKEAERQRQLEEQERIERQREIDRQREERQFENQNYSYIGEQPKSEAIPKSKPENPNLMNKNGEESAKSMSPQEPFNLGKLVGELRIGEREYRQLENDVLVTKVMDVPPMIHENRTMLPARVVAELLNIDVDFDDASKTAYFRYDGNLIELALGQQRMKINGEEKMLSANVLNVQGRVLMPITDIQRALVDLGLHVDVNWKHFEKEVQVIDKDK